MRLLANNIIFIILSFCVLLPAAGCGDSKEKPRRFPIPSGKAGAPVFSEGLITSDEPTKKSGFSVDFDALKDMTAKEVVGKAWGALGAGEYDLAIKIADYCIERFIETAKQQQDELGGVYPGPKDVENYGELNAVGAAVFIKGEAFQKKGECDAALKEYQRAVVEFPLAQNWDTKGWYWKVRDEAQLKIDKIKENGCN